MALVKCPECGKEISSQLKKCNNCGYKLKQVDKKKIKKFGIIGVILTVLIIVSVIVGINISKNYGNIECICDKIVGEKIHFDFPSVGATENTILLSCLGEGTVTITNAAREPEIVDLQNFLNKMGAKIKVILCQIELKQGHFYAYQQ